MGSRCRTAVLLALAGALALAVPAHAQEIVPEPPPVLPPAPPAIEPYSDVPGDYWADGAIRETAEERHWMRVPGDEFKPNRLVTKRLLARALVRAFAPTDVVDPTIAFGDLPAGDSWYRYANVAVARGWFRRTPDFDPDGEVSKRVLARALVRALGLTEEVRALANLSTEDGYRFKLPKYFPYLVLANELHLNHNFRTGEEHKDLYPWEPVTRAYAANALWRAHRASGGWQLWSAMRYRSIVLPKMSEGRRKVVTFALRYVGYPYVYAGEWYRARGQAHGGFDCSGFVWWVMKEPAGGWDPTVVRPYDGWKLPQRVSRDMARAAPVRYSLDELRVMDLMFWDTDSSGRGWDDVDHTGLWLGNGWMVHSSGSRGGVTVSWGGDGWWADAFDWGRRLIGT